MGHTVKKQTNNDVDVLGVFFFFFGMGETKGRSMKISKILVILDFNWTH